MTERPFGLSKKELKKIRKEAPSDNYEEGLSYYFDVFKELLRGEKKNYENKTI